MTIHRAEDIHPSITLDRVTDAVERQTFGTDNPGFCIACGAEHDECEPDAEGYDCDHCDEPKVYGAMAILFMM